MQDALYAREMSSRRSSSRGSAFSGHKLLSRRRSSCTLSLFNTHKDVPAYSVSVSSIMLATKTSASSASDQLHTHPNYCLRSLSLWDKEQGDRRVSKTDFSAASTNVVVAKHTKNGRNVAATGVRGAKLILDSNRENSTNSRTKRGSDKDSRETSRISLESRACARCGKSLSDPTEVTRHEGMCPLTEVPCPLLCGKVLRRGDIPQHVREEALQHGPLCIPRVTNYAADDPIVVIAILMDMLLEQRSSKSAGVDHPGSASINDIAPKTCKETDQASKFNNSPAISYRSTDISPLPRQTTAETPVGSNIAAPFARIDSGESNATTSRGQAPEPRTNIPQPASRDIVLSALSRGFECHGSADELTARINAKFTSCLRPVEDALQSSAEGAVGAMKTAPLVPVNQVTLVGTGSSIIDNDTSVGALFARIEAQQREVSKLRTHCTTLDFGKLSDNRREQISRGIRNAIEAIESKNKQIHADTMHMANCSGTDTTQLLSLLERWRFLNQHWHDVRFALKHFVPSH